MEEEVEEDGTMVEAMIMADMITVIMVGMMVEDGVEEVEIVEAEEVEEIAVVAEEEIVVVEENDLDRNIIFYIFYFYSFCSIRVR